MEWDGQVLYGKAKILNTPQGQIAKELVKEGQIGISSRGLGTVAEDGTVNEDYNLLTWDLVTDPSNGPSWVNGIYEGKQWGLGEEVVTEDSISEAQAKEEYFRHIMESIRAIEKHM